ncbi:MAG TPA: hypothetical protein VFF52_23060 [Isosphaeraceae bacterium]|nr:hypothetical protein [Isosphaeraceae bacterium]
MNWSMLMTFLAVLVVTDPARAPGGESSLRIALFQVDATPPLGSPLCEGAVQPAHRIEDPLSCRGIVFLSGARPIVVCALDWVGIGNAGHDAWRAALAEAAGTSPERVAVHCLHQHDAPGYDLSAEELMAGRDLPGKGFDPAFGKAVIDRAARALQAAIPAAQPVTHLGAGKAEVKQVASNRRVLGGDGRVRHVRWSSMPDPKVRAAPEGIIDPMVRVVSLWNGDRAVAVLSYYATHPQSYYGKGGVSCDFVGLARRLREQALPGVFLVHFNGAAGNVTAGKYNDGSPPNRPALAHRLADGMAAALADSAAHKTPITAGDLAWHIRPVALPVSPRLAEDELARAFASRPRFGLARDLAWMRLRRQGRTIDLAELQLGPARILHLPGELFVEYQLFAQRLRPDLFVAMAAYGDYGPGYIGTRLAYTQGGYETGPPSRVAPEVEEVLAAALRDLLEANDRAADEPSRITATAPRLEGPAGP